LKPHQLIQNQAQNEAGTLPEFLLINFAA
jgi:hypothetical protein